MTEKKCGNLNGRLRSRNEILTILQNFLREKCAGTAKIKGFFNKFYLFLKV